MKARAPFIIALDQGTTSSRAILYDSSGTELKVAQRTLPATFPHDGWVEQNPQEIWSGQLAVLEEVATGVSLPEVAALALTNQRETIVAWDRRSGEPLAPAIVWQCRRSASICDRLKNAGAGALVGEKTGLVLDPYFSATKILWMQEHVPGMREAVRDGRALFGTVDSWLMYRLSAGKSFVTEPSNASRTMLFNLKSGDWDEELLRMFSLTRDNLPEVRPSDRPDVMSESLGHALPVRAVLGDQQASLYGHGCLAPNSAKCTFGTGAFLLFNTGTELRRSTAGLLSTVAWKTGSSALVYALEGSVFVAGAAVQWLRDNLGFIRTSAESEELARRAKESGVVFIPAFVGLGAPHWNNKVRGALYGITRDTSREQIVLAALEGVAHQVADILGAEELSNISSLRIDGGMTANSLFCQILADLTGVRIEVAPLSETTAYGTAALAAASSGMTWTFSEDTRKSYLPALSAERKESARILWAAALKSLLSAT